jgi:hypothetical protein
MVYIWFVLFSTTTMKMESELARELGKTFGTDLTYEFTVYDSTSEWREI